MANAVNGVGAVEAGETGAKGNERAGTAYRLCGAEHGGVLLVALVRCLLEEGEGPRELERVRFHNGRHRSAPAQLLRRQHLISSQV